jgi:hypothetical protein
LAGRPVAPAVGGATMGTARRPINRGFRRQLTPEAIAAWEASDFQALHRALGLSPADASPLPCEITALGVDDDDGDPDSERTNLRGDGPWKRSLKRAVAWQRQLLRIAGWPDCRQEYEKNLADAEKWAAYCHSLVEGPWRGGQGTGCDPVSRRRSLQEAEERVAWRKQLLAELDEVRERWKPKR